MIRIGYLALVSVVLFLVFYSMAFINSPFSFGFNDTWEHSATLNALILDPWSPSNPHVASDDTSPRFMPLYIAGAVLGRMANLDAIAVYHWVSLVNIAVVFAGLFLFSRRYFDFRFAPEIVAATLLFAWGTGIVWSNSTMLGALPIVAGYPSFFVLGLTFFAWWLGLGVLRNIGSLPLSVRFVTLTLLMALAITSHVLTAVIAAGGLGAFALFETKVRWTNRVLVLAAIPLAFGAAELWPYFSTMSFLLPGGDYHLSGAPSRLASSMERAISMLERHAFYDWPKLGFGLGVALFAPFFAAYHLVKRQYHALVASFAVLTAVYVSNLFIAIPLGHRALLFAVMFGHLLMAAAFMDFLKTYELNQLLKPVQFIRQRPLAAVLCGVLLITCLVNLGNAAYKLRPLNAITSTTDHTGRGDWVATYRRVTAPLAEESVVMARAADGWPLPSFAGKTVALLHPNPFVLDPSKRRIDTKRFFSPDTNDAIRECIIKRWRVTHVLTRHQDNNVIAFLQNRAGQVSSAEPFKLYELSKGLVTGTADC